MRASKGKIVNMSASADRELRQQLGCIRKTWNHFLAANMASYESVGTFIFFHEMSAQCTKVRAADPWFRTAPRGAQTCALKALNRALRDSFASAKVRKGFPRFRKAADQRDAMTIQAADLGLVRENGFLTYVRWPKVGLLRVKGARLPDKARVAFVTLRQIADGYQLSFNFEIEEQPVVAGSASGEPLGIDLGLSSLITLSTGEKVDAPQHYRRSLKRLRGAQRSLSRKQRGSVNRRRQRKRVARCHARIACLRENHLHQLSRKLIDRHQLIVLEDLALGGMIRTKLALSIADAGWGELRRQMEYKARWAGRQVLYHPRFARSTGVCPDCGHTVPRMALAVRSWTCPRCAATHDRDVAAARVIARSALVGAASPEPAPRVRSLRKKRASASMCQAKGSPSPDRAGSATNVSGANMGLQKT